MKCPKRYGAYDVMGRDCPHCKQGYLYQICKLSTHDVDHNACAGWNTEEGEPSCCICYKETYDSDSETI